MLASIGDICYTVLTEAPFAAKSYFKERPMLEKIFGIDSYILMAIIGFSVVEPMKRMVPFSMAGSMESDWDFDQR